jgi:hypothetical protein
MPPSASGTIFVVFWGVGNWRATRRLQRAFDGATRFAEGIKRDAVWTATTCSGLTALKDFYCTASLGRVVKSGGEGRRDGKHAALLDGSQQLNTLLQECCAVVLEDLDQHGS